MNAERWQQVERLYQAARERHTSQRSVFLKEACAGDKALQREVESLLANEKRMENFLEAPALEAAAKVLVEDQSQLLIGRLIGSYKILSLLGAGGMGEVYKAKDTKLGRDVAIKLLPAEATKDAEAKRRLLKEARLASALNHPGIVTIYSVDEHDGLDFIVMEYVDGETLAACIKREVMRLPSLLDIGVQVADALNAAHSVGFIHRDIKSANIVITPRGQAKVLDFGLAKILRPVLDRMDHDASTMANLTVAGTVLGTVAYMSPEQTRSEALDARSDLFSLGCALYEAATGRLPFIGPSSLSIMHAIATVDPPPPSSLRQELPLEFDLIIARALGKDKEQRYSSAAEMADALRSLRGRSAEDLPGVTAIAGVPSFERGESFVGREPEMKKLGGFLQQAVKGSGRVIFITGEPGIGKTALVDEFLRRSRQQHPSLLFSRGHCVEQYGTGEAYLPFLDAVGLLLGGPSRERITALLRTHAPTWCLQFPSSFASSATIEKLQQETIGATKERMLREMADALGALASQTPAVLLLEDLHWADASSVDLLRHLCRRVGTQRLLVVGTFRPEDIERSHHPLKAYKLEMQAHKLCEEIALGSLSQEHIAAYLDVSFAPNDFPRELPSLIERKTEGHPLFATNLVQFLAERGDIARVHAHWSLVRPLSEMDLEVPESARSLIRRKIDALEEEDRRALQYASIEGEEFLSTVVAKLLGVDELALEERFAHLERSHRLVVRRGEEELPDGSLATQYRFAHALYQNVLYGDVVSKRRILLHRQVGEQLARHFGEQSTRIASQLAMHFERGRDFGRAIAYLIHAGDTAARLYANAEAQEHYTHALSLVEKLSSDERAEKLIALYQKRGMVHFAQSHFLQAGDDLTAMLGHARGLNSPAHELAALNALGRTLFFSHRLEEFAVRTQEALDVAERAGNEALRVETMTLVGLKHLCYGELVDAKRAQEDVLRIARSLNHKPPLVAGLCWRGMLYFFQSQYERAVELLTEAGSLASELRDGFMLLNSFFGLSLAQGNLGHISEALATLNVTIEMAQRNGDRFVLPRLHNCIGWIHREVQDFDHALRYDQQGLEVAREYHVLEAEANSLINLGMDHLHAGNGEKTALAFHEAEDIFSRDVWLRWRYNIRLQAGAAERWLAQGDLEKARECTERLLETATQHEAHKYIAVAHKLFAQAAVASGDTSEAEKQFSAALDELREYPAPLAAWKNYAALGRLRLQLSDRSSAREAFAQAADIIRSIAAHIVDERLRATFLNSAAVREVVNGAGCS